MSILLTPAKITAKMEKESFTRPGERAGDDSAGCSSRTGVQNSQYLQSGSQISGTSVPGDLMPESNLFSQVAEPLICHKCRKVFPTATPREQSRT